MGNKSYKLRYLPIFEQDLNNTVNYISWEMTPTSIGGEQQAGISGGSQSPS